MKKNWNNVSSTSVIPKWGSAKHYVVFREKFQGIRDMLTSDTAYFQFDNSFPFVIKSVLRVESPKPGLKV